MKKIIALVLCLALALSLCTVAFAATTHSVANETGLKTAISSAVAGDTIKLTANIDVTVPAGTSSSGGAALELTKNITIDGDGYTIKANDGSTFTGSATRGDFHVFGITEGTVTIKNLTVDGNGKSRSGINVWSDGSKTVNVVLENVTSKNNTTYGVTAVGNSITLNNVTTSGNGWGGVNVDTRGTLESKLVVNGGTFNEANSLYVEKYASATGTSAAEINGGTFVGEVHVAKQAGGTDDVDNASLVVSGGTFEDAGTKAEIESSYLAPGLELNASGTVYTPSGTGLSGEYFWQLTSSPLNKNCTDKTSVSYTAAKAPKTENGKTEPGNVAYYQLPDAFVGKYYVEVATLAEADVVVGTKADMTGNHYLYLDEIPAADYVNASVFTNFGKKCGQVNETAETGKTYYLREINGVKSLVVGSTTGNEIVVVNGKIVKVAAFKAYTPVQHIAAPIVHKTTGQITGYTCSTCGLAAIDAKNAASIPTGGQQITGGWYFPAAGTTGTLVESAKTFDAGIALYAGLALASVAGSAVMLGKKKEF